MINTPQILQLDGAGGAVKSTFSTLETSQELHWVRIPPHGVRAFFKQQRSTSVLALKFLSAEETRPRTVFYNDSLLATFRGVNMNNDEEPEDMVSIRLWITHNRIVSVQHRRLEATAGIEKDLSLNKGPRSVAEFLEKLLITLINQSAEVVATLSDELDAIEDKDISLLDETENPNQLSEIRRCIILLHRHLTPQREAIHCLSDSKLSFLTSTNLEAIRETANTNTLILENLQAERERAKVIQEEFYALDQKRLNKKMYLLAIISVIFMPLTFITGLLGVNLGGIPGATSTYAFTLLIVLLIVIGFIQVKQLRKKRWL